MDRQTLVVVMHSLTFNPPFPPIPLHIAMDDGGGFVTAWEAVRVLASLGLRAKRTIRAVVWVNEENGSAGGITYANQSDLSKHSWMSECDEGAFQPYGIGVTCGTNLDCSASIAQLTTLGSLLSSIGSGNVSVGGGGTDIDPSCQTGVVCAGFNVLDPRLTPDANNPCMTDNMNAWTIPTYDINKNLPYDSQYFWIHHSTADTVERMDPRQLNHVAAASATWAYAIASLPTLLPRNAAAPLPPNSSPAATLRTVSVPVQIALSVFGSLAIASGSFFIRRWRRKSSMAATTSTAYNPLSQI